MSWQELINAHWTHRNYGIGFGYSYASEFSLCLVVMGIASMVLLGVWIKRLDGGKK